MGLNEDLCATGIGILPYFRAWLLVHRIHVQECVSVHGFVGLLPTTPPSLKEHRMEPSELAHRSQPQELWAEHLQEQFEYGEVLVISFLNAKALFFLQSFCSPMPMVQLSIFFSI